MVTFQILVLDRKSLNNCAKYLLKSGIKDLLMQVHLYLDFWANILILYGY